VVAKVRSGYADNRKPIPPGHKASFAKSLEPLDKKLRDANLALSDDQYIEAMRVAKGPALDWDELKALWKGISVPNEVSFEAFAEQLMPLFSSLLLFASKEDVQQSNYDHVSALIWASDDSQFEIARKFCRMLARPEFSELVIEQVEPGTETGPRREASETIAHSVENGAEWAALVLVQCLVLARIFPITATEAEMGASIRILGQGNWTLSDLNSEQSDASRRGNGTG
jgi:hypothetical protein